MKLPVNLSIARTHMLSRARQTTVAMLGVTFGIGMFILIVSFMKGMNEFFGELMLASIPDVRLYNDITTDYSTSVAADYYKGTGKSVALFHPKPKQVAVNLKNAPDILKGIHSNPAVAAVSSLLNTQYFTIMGQFN